MCDGTVFQMEKMFLRCQIFFFLLVCTSVYQGAPDFSEEPGPAELPPLRLLKARGPAMQDFVQVVRDPGWELNFILYPHDKPFVSVVRDEASIPFVNRVQNIANDFVFPHFKPADFVFPRFKPVVPESRGQKSGSHSRDCTTTILLQRFSKLWCTMLVDEYFSRVYDDEFLPWYAQRATKSCKT